MVVAAVLLLCTPGVPGLAKPPADTAPVVSGPAVPNGLPDCWREIMKGPQPGSVVAVKHICLWSYLFNPAMDNDSDNGYFIDWVQTTLNPKPGWCVDYAENQLGRTPGELTALSNGYPERVRKNHSATVVLEASADGNASAPVTVSQSFDLHRGQMTWGTFRNNLAVVWRGRTPKTVSLGLGIESVHPLETETGTYRIRVGFYSHVFAC